MRRCFGRGCVVQMLLSRNGIRGHQHNVTAKMNVHLGSVNGYKGSILLWTRIDISATGIDLPNTEGQEQAGGSAIEQTLANLYIQGSTDCTTDSNQLNVTWLELPVGGVVDALHRGCHGRATSLAIVGGLFWVGGDLLVSFVFLRGSQVNAGRGHGG